MTDQPLILGAVLYEGFELLDMFGPLEMFTAVAPEVLQVVMIAEKKGAVKAGSMANSPMPTCIADYGFDDAPDLDLILVPGGIGTFAELENDKMLSFLRDRAEKAQITASVCSGSALLAKAGLLDGHRATSNKMFFNLAVTQSDKVAWIEAARWVEDGKFVTSSGVSAGIDMALAIIARLFGNEVAETIAKGAEYIWHREADVDPFAQYLNEGSI
ncbi:MAG: DJ-1/PfpI family protein [Gammaproteobacteria bacterium]|jgi:transcriptional regulator GlxA family with amidase domain|nr:DJ-1/PfpI family protein [Gammaproteobacteria bacterium]